MSEAIRGDVLTKERASHKEVKIRPGTHGGVDHYVPSFLDALLDYEIIDRSQHHDGMVYWGLRTAALRFMQPENSIYGEIPDETPALHTDNQGDALSVLTILNAMIKDHVDALTACCQDHNNRKELIVQAFGENALVAAFKALEESLPLAREEYTRRENNEKNYLQTA